LSGELTDLHECLFLQTVAICISCPALYDTVGEKRTVFTALHAMQTRSSDENSDRLSVRPSVRHTRAL